MSDILTGTRIARYEIVSPLGAGGMGEVYKAYDPTLERHVALKLLPLGAAPTDDALRRFAREAKAASGLNHPNIITVYEIGHAAVGDTPVNYIAMELVEGKTLREFFSGKFDMEKALLYFSQIAEGLAKAHAAGIVHRDLKPENIMITVDGYAKILDFGLAKSDGTQPIDAEGKTDVRSAAITREGMVMGTVGYMSPEQVRGYGVDSRSDIFSLGCILYEAATHRQPFRGNSAVDTFHKIAYESPPPMTDADPPVTPELQRVIRKSLAKDPGERYQSAKEIAIDLREIRREYESGGHLSGAVARPLLRPGFKARYVWIAGGIALMVIAVSVAIIRTRRAPRDRGGFETMSIERLPNTSNVRQAAISPDGRTIAHVEGGPKGESILVRQLSSGSEIVAVPADGDEYSELAFSKDGESIRYIHRNTLLQTSVLGGPGKRLINNVTGAVTFSPDGKRCAFVRDRSLFVAASDGSDARRIGIRGTKREYYSRPAWSPRDAVIACTKRTVMTLLMGIEIVHPFAAEAVAEADAHAPPLGGWRFAITSMEWLPDGSGVVVSAQQRPSTERQLYEISYPDGRVRRITNDLFHYEGVSLSADGAVLVSRQTDKRSIIWLVPLDHPEKSTRLIEASGTIWDVTSLPDGGFLYTATAAGNADIWRSNADGSDRKRLTDDPHDDGSPAVSPDGRFIVFASDRSGPRALWRMNMDGSNPVKITSGEFDGEPAFSPDGKKLYFTSRRSGSPAVWQMPVDGSSAPVPASFSRRPLFSPRTSRTWEGSTNGRMIAASDVAGKIVISDTNGKVIHVFDEISENILWARDSRAIVYSRESAIYLQDLAGGPPRKIADFSPDEIGDFDWSADGRSLLCVRTSYQRAAVVLKNFR